MRSLDADCIEPFDLKHRMKTTPSAQVVIDVDMPQEFRRAHIPGAINAPFHELDQHVAILRELSATRTIVLVSHTGNRALKSASKLAEVGVERTAVLVGGLEGWALSGGSIKRPMGWRRVMTVVLGAAAAALVVMLVL
jgi:rhodanese-related sulfurtransferase